MFPYKQGYYWNFQYATVSGGMVGSSTDSGKVRWEILEVGVLETIPLQYRIKIQQIKTLERRITNYFVIDPSINYDSTYNPPRVVSTDTFTISGTEGINGYTKGDDTCWSFIHDDNSAQNKDQVTLTKKTVKYQGSDLNAFEVNPSICRQPGNDSIIILPTFAPEYFTLAHGYGPVAYFRGSSPLLLDFNFRENWTLLETNANNPTSISKFSQDLKTISLNSNFLDLKGLDISGEVRAVLLNGSSSRLSAPLASGLDALIRIPVGIRTQPFWILQYEEKNQKKFIKVLNLH